MREQAAARPFRTIAVALGAGYVLGGGLFSPLTARLVGLMARVGLRMAALPLVSEALGLAAQGLIATGDDRIPPGTKGPQT
jgi:hypothetical protein